MNNYMPIKSKQSGAALVVSMVMLMVLTMLAISTMSTASLEVTMAGNNQYSENAFQLAETGLDQYIATVAANPGCANTLNPDVCDIDGPDPGVVAAMGGTYQAQATFLNDFDGCPGSSKGTLASYHFEVQATGQTTNQGATSQHSQGWLLCRNK
jgi:type IV pilus assembly protein PilX